FAPGEDELYQPFKSSMEEIRGALDEVISLYRSGIATGTIDYDKMDELVTTKVRANGDSFRASGDKLLDFHVQRAHNRTQSAAATATESAWLMLIAISVGVIAGSLFVFFFSRNLVSSLLSVSESLKDSGFKVSAGAT